MSELSDFRVAVIATDGFEESELTEPVKALKDAGAEVTILSLKPGKIQGNVNPPPPDNTKPKKPPENDCSGQQAGSKGCPKP